MNSYSEANEDQEDEADELARLNEEQDMPIGKIDHSLLFFKTFFLSKYSRNPTFLEELLKMYGAAPGGDQEEPDDKAEEEGQDEVNEPAPATPKEKVKSDHAPAADEKVAVEVTDSENPLDQQIKDDPTNSKRRGSGSPTPPSSKKSRSELARFYEAAVEGRNLRSQGGGQPDEIEEEEYEEGGEDSDTEKQDYSWKKTIMIGPSYQASVPSDLAAYGDTLPYGTY